MKKKLIYALFSVSAVLAVGALNLKAAARSITTAQQKVVRESGYNLGYSAGSVVGYKTGTTDRAVHVADNQQRRTMPENILSREAQRAPSRNYARAYLHAEYEFIESYRSGLGAGWTDGYQRGYACYQRP